MPAFPEPEFDYDYDLSTQIEALRSHRALRRVPRKSSGRLLLATWNIANLGVQKRVDDDHALIAEILRWFDVIAIQEVNDDLAGLRSIVAHMPARYKTLFSDSGGNDERLAYLYDSEKLTVSDEVGEVSVPPSELDAVRLPGVDVAFEGFDRNPYLATFTTGSFSFSLVNCHSYFGSGSEDSIGRRTLETYAIARWADYRHRSRHAPTKDIIPLGDLNLPKVQPGDPIYDALTRRGLVIPKHSTRTGSSIATDNHYDQLAFFPGDTMDDYVRSGVFDFDTCVFRHLYESRGLKDFLAYVRYHVSDHRPLWAQFAIAG